MENNSEYALRRVFFLGKFRRYRILELIARRREYDPEPLFFLGRSDPDNLSAGEQLVLDRVIDVDLGELHNWGDLPQGTPELIFKVIIVDLSLR